MNTVLFYNAASVLYSVLDGTLCNDEQCPMMNAGPNYEYLWADGVKVKNPIKLSAPRYVNALFDHVEEQLDDPSLFPRGNGCSGCTRTCITRISGPSWLWGWRAIST